MPLSKWSAWGKQVMWLTNKLCFFFKLFLCKFTQTHKRERKIQCTLDPVKRAQIKHVNSLLYVCWTDPNDWSDTEFSVRCKHHMTVAKLRLSVKKKKQKRKCILSLLHFWINNSLNIYVKYLSAVMYVQLNFAMSCCFYAIFLEETEQYLNEVERENVMKRIMALQWT